MGHRLPGLSTRLLQIKILSILERQVEMVRLTECGNRPYLANLDRQNFLLNLQDNFLDIKNFFSVF